MLIETLVFTLFGLLLGVSVWWIWRQRQVAQRQAEMNERLATLGKTVDGVAHDLSNLANIIAINLETFRIQPAGDARELFGDVEQAARAVRNLVDACRSRSGTAPPRQGSVDGILRMTIALMRRAGAQIAPFYEGDLLFDGGEVEALRVIQNLLSNAVRETQKIPQSIVKVVLREGQLAITNPVLDAAKLDDRIYEYGVSHSGSSGAGLNVSREIAARLGWTLRHEVQGDSVTFILERAPQAGPLLAA